MNRPWMPFYVADYLRDTGHLSTLEHGAYLLLIFAYWSNHGLPNNDAQLARIARVSPKQWREVRPTLSAFFQDGWRHRRIDRELTESEEKYDRRANAGRLGGIARNGGKQSSSNATPTPKQSNDNAEAYAGARQSQSQPELPTGSAAPHERGRDELDSLEAELLVAAKLTDAVHPGLTDLSPMLSLLDAGYDLEGEILPVIRKRRKPEVRSWAYFVPAIHEARAVRQASASGSGPARFSPQSNGNATVRAGQRLLAELENSDAGSQNR